MDITKCLKVIERVKKSDYTNRAEITEALDFAVDILKTFSRGGCCAVRPKLRGTLRLKGRVIRGNSD